MPEAKAKPAPTDLRKHIIPPHIKINSLIIIHSFDKCTIHVRADIQVNSKESAGRCNYSLSKGSRAHGV